jgi:hypothetical protein
MQVLVLAQLTLLSMVAVPAFTKPQPVTPPLVVPMTPPNVAAQQMLGLAQPMPDPISPGAEAKIC